MASDPNKANKCVKYAVKLKSVYAIKLNRNVVNLLECFFFCKW